MIKKILAALFGAALVQQPAPVIASEPVPEIRDFSFNMRFGDDWQKLGAPAERFFANLNEKGEFHLYTFDGKSLSADGPMPQEFREEIRRLVESLDLMTLGAKSTKPANGTPKWSMSIFFKRVPGKYEDVRPAVIVHETESFPDGFGAKAAKIVDFFRAKAIECQERAPRVIASLSLEDVGRQRSVRRISGGETPSIAYYGTDGKYVSLRITRDYFESIQKEVRELEPLIRSSAHSQGTSLIASFQSGLVLSSPAASSQVDSPAWIETRKRLTDIFERAQSLSAKPLLNAPQGGPFKAFSFGSGAASATSGLSIEVAERLTLEGPALVARIRKGYRPTTDVEVILTPEELREISDLIRDHSLADWNGFERYDHRVMDGTSFSMSMTDAQGRSSHANGYMAFPTGFREVSQKIRAFSDRVLARATAVK